MNIYDFTKKILFDKTYRFLFLTSLGFYDKMPDEKYLEKRFNILMPYRLNIHNPVTFNEKLQWLKIHNRIPLLTQLVDKYEVKDYIIRTIGEEYVIPTIGVWDSFKQIDFNSLPTRFVLKCTHDSGSIAICKNKENFDFGSVETSFNRALKTNLFYAGREWPYKNVKPRIMAEQLIQDSNGELNDYKFFCFNGKVRCFKVDFDRFTSHGANYFNRDLELLHFGEVICPPNYQKDISLPENIDEMIAIAEKLSKEFVFVRVDLYNVDGKIYFGEMTFYPASGFGIFTSEDADIQLGKWLDLKGN